MAASSGRVLRLQALVTMSACALAGTAFAQQDVNYLQMLWDTGGDDLLPQTYNMVTESDSSGFEDGMYFYQGGTGQLEWDLSWDIRTTESGVQGPPGGNNATVTADIAMVNLLPVPQVFSALVIVNLDSPILGATFMDGDVSGTILDLLDANGFAEFTNVGASPVYEARVDGGGVRTLWQDPYSLQAVGAPGTFPSASDDDLFANEELGGPANNSIAVWLQVEVSAFDQVNVIGTFEVVPAPGVAPLLALAGLVGARRRRR